MKSSQWLPFVACVLCQCTGTETGNPVCDDDLKVGVAPLTATVARPRLGNVHFESVAIELASVALESCAGQQSTVLLQDQALDLFDPRVSQAQVPAGTYCAMIISMGGSTDSFSAGRQVSNGQTSLTFDSQLRVRARLALLEPLVTTGSQPSWILAVDLAEWLTPIDAWLQSGASQLSLNDPETAALRLAQARSLRLYKDIDDDGQLDSVDVATPLSESGISQP